MREKIAKEILDRYNFPDLLNSKNWGEYHQQRAEEFCSWRKTHGGRSPSSHGGDEIESKFYDWWNKERKARKYVTIVQDVMRKHGFEDFYVVKSLQEISAEMCQRVCDFIKTNGRDPYGKGNEEEKLLYNWLSPKRQATKGKGSVRLYDEDKIVAKKNGLEDLFKTKNEDMCQRVCEYKKSHNGDDPTGSNPEARWLSYRRRNKNLITEEDKTTIKKYGFIDLFDVDTESAYKKKLEKISNEICVRVCEWKKSHDGKDPSQKAIGEEGKLGKWLSMKRLAKKELTRGVLYPSDVDVANSYGYSDLFETVRK